MYWRGGEFLPSIQTRICHSLRLRMKFKSLFMSSKDEYDLPLLLNLSKQFLAPGV